MNNQVRFIPEGQFSNNDLAAFVKELEAFYKGKEVMHRSDAAIFLGVSERTIDRLSLSGAIPYHTIQGLHGKLYLRSELIEVIKNS
jgi:hypothetical protein